MRLEKKFAVGFGEYIDELPESFSDCDLALLEDVDTIGLYNRDGSISGFIAYRIKSESRTVFLELAKSYHEGEGVFRGLFSSLKDLAHGADCNKVVLSVGETNDRALDIYEHYGFKETGRSYVGTNSLNFLEMALRLR